MTEDTQVIADLLAESIANALMIYGAHDEDCTPEKPCRVCFRCDTSEYIYKLAEMVTDTQLRAVRQELEEVRKAYEELEVESDRRWRSVHSAASSLLGEMRSRRAETDFDRADSDLESSLLYELRMLREGAWEHPDDGLEVKIEVAPEDLEAGKHGHLRPLLAHIRREWEKDSPMTPLCGTLKVMNRQGAGELRLQLWFPLIMDLLSTEIREAWTEKLGTLDFFDCVKEQP